MNSTSPYSHYVKPHLAEILAALGLDVAYTRAQGNYLFHRDPNGDEIPVLDLLGGYGSLIFGHNPVAIRDEARRLLDAQVPNHAQFSLREEAGALAERLNGIFKRELKSEEDWNVVFANSGAEAIEAAVKHAELERVQKLEKLLDQITLNIDRTRRALRRGEAAIPEDIYAHATIREQVFDVRDFDELVVGLINHNTAQLVHRPVFVLLEKSFHGKLIGSVQLTYNKNFRRPFQFLGLKSRFVPAQQPELIARIVEEERLTLYDLDVQEGIVRIVEREMPIFAAFLVEPIQGEGGVHVLPAEMALSMRKHCNELDCPLIVDEIQSGMGRSGTFLASTQIPLKGDYYTLSKSLGGGICKLSATLIRRSRLQKIFCLIHSSTFAEDTLSSGIALKVLDLLEAEGGKAYQRIQETSRKLLGALNRVQKAYPSVIREVRGMGLFIGVEFQDQKEASSIIIRGSAYNDSFGYVLSGYLLREEKIRIAPPGSAPNVLRIEPGFELSDDEITRIEAAFTRLCDIVLKQDALHFVFPLTKAKRPKPRQDVRDFRNAFPPPETTRSLSPTRPVRKVAFINHLISSDYLQQVDPSLAELLPEELREFVLRMDPAKRTAPYPPVRIHSPLGSAVDFILYPLCVISEQMGRYLTEGDLESIREDIEERVKSAKEDGCEVAGLGMYTSIVTNNGLSLRVPDMAITTGNALTIAMGMEAMEDALATKGWSWEDRSVVIVGAAGNIASTYAALLSERTTKLTLVGSAREGSQNRLKRTVELLYEEAWMELEQRPKGRVGALASLLREAPLVKQWLLTGAPPNCGRQLAAHFAQAQDAPVTLTVDRAAIREGDLVLCSANAPEPFLGPEDFKQGAIVCDIAVPNNVIPGIAALRPDLVYQQGGIVATPHGESLHPSARAFLQGGELFACMAETVVLGLSGMEQHYSYGAISKSQVREIAALAKLHGFSLSGYKSGSSL